MARRRQIRGRFARLLEGGRGDRTQAEVAEACGVTQGAVCSWELGRLLPALDRVPRVAAVYGRDTDALTAAWVETVRRRRRKAA